MQSSGQVGGLRRQLERKRGGMSVRALMENFGELITQILPCTLMSPDSVARFFPARAGHLRHRRVRRGVADQGG